MDPRAVNSRAHDLVVIGAGIVGLSCAWRAAQAGLSVMVVERDEPGAGASGVAAGMLAPVTEADFGEEELLALNLESARHVAGLRRGARGGQRHAVRLRGLGGAGGGGRPRRRRGACAACTPSSAPGLESEWLAPTRARGLEPGLSPRLGGAILAPQDGHVGRARWWRRCRRAWRRGWELRAGVEVDGC